MKSGMSQSRDPLAPFGQKVTEDVKEGAAAAAGPPWVSTTPMRTVQTRMPTTAPTQNLQDTEKEKEKQQGEGAEVLLKLAAVREKLKVKGIADDELLTSLQEAESAVNGPAQTQKLTHKVVTQLQKAEKAKESLKTQLKELDAKWMNWHEYMKNKHKEQRELYMDNRKALLERYGETRTKIAELKEEIKNATTQLMAGQEGEEVSFLEFSVQDAFVEERIDLTCMSDDEEPPKTRKGRTRVEAGSRSTSRSRSRSKSKDQNQES